MPYGSPSSGALSGLSRLRGHATLVEHFEGLLAEGVEGGCSSCSGTLERRLPPGSGLGHSVGRGSGGSVERCEEAGDWRETCRTILADDRAAVRQLQASGALVSFGDEGRLNPGAPPPGGSAEVVSGRQYPNRGNRSSLVKPPPPVPTAQPHSLSKFSAKLRIARRNLGLPQQPSLRGGSTPRGDVGASRLPPPPAWPAPAWPA
mmetsp:Transcript_146620/g.365628  ORF Transcript_146620/g.365628 Transcript_146620/m.365628 type:complete len:204 (+) Transcript_146620:85-696(+)